MPPMTKPLVFFQNAGKIYETGTVALAGFELEVRAGEFLTLLGPSGCGKSTVLRLIAGLDDLTSGMLTRGFALNQASLGFVFQDPTLMPWANVFDNVYLPLRLRGTPRNEAVASIEKALALVGLSSFTGAYPRELSGGMRMRASIARALVLRPLILLMDEPFAALDEITRFKLNDDLLRLQCELGTTIVFVTHSVFESVFLSTSIAVMAARPGRVVAKMAIEVPFPRSMEYRTSPIYARSCAEVSRALQRAMEESGIDV
jgi:NitT/TauT family transport system ATP-binding protein